MPQDASAQSPWPPLPIAEWSETCTTLHLWTQIVGKVRLACTPWLNHSWHVTLYVSARGLSTDLIPHGRRAFDMEFDLLADVLRIRSADGGSAEIRLQPGPVAGFYAEVLGALDRLGLETKIDGAPNEMAEATPFAEDRAVRAYDAAAARRFWRVLLQADRLLKEFRSSFVGKASPVHFFWGSFDLAETRFSGRRAPRHPAGVPHCPDAVVLDAYSDEVSSAGFWPGGMGQDASFYAYAYPEPEGFKDAKVAAPGYYEPALGEFLLPYEKVRTAPDPDRMVLDFLRSTYAAAADLGRWDRAALECAMGQPRVVRAV
jgi:hypothetical protein